ncbi:hypothetical protein V1639_11630 [Pseudarthrobacter sp. J75]|uniref:hypothetical protein n=1 Tax=unclassified Pseudarthrobacter TaxID=2647000 RepID=UPI002E8079AF|nr:MULTISPECIES: hypothetical protein [unclassified Pseudarthrobacter]MEE2522808.1 hypothetical protein [Pseudarthrobacter sp. J47]MEE2529669.1 hypothetical protein [Pseudarthrobacter sp. J75]
MTFFESMNRELRQEVLYGRDAEALRVFVSSRMNGTLDDERAAAVDAINKFPTHRSWSWEKDAPAGALHSENECIGFAGTSDELVLLLARDLTPITEAEYRAAKQNGAQRYVFIREGDSREQDENVKTFIAEERADRTVTRYFQNIDELQTHLVNSIKQAQVRASREQILVRRNLRIGRDGS